MRSELVASHVGGFSLPMNRCSERARLRAQQRSRVASFPNGGNGWGSHVAAPGTGALRAVASSWSQCAPILAWRLPRNLTKNCPHGQPRLGLRWLAGNGADTAFRSRLSTASRGASQSGVCPHPSPTAVQDADLPTRTRSGSSVRCGNLFQGNLSQRGTSGEREEIQEKSCA